MASSGNHQKDWAWMRQQNELLARIAVALEESNRIDALLLNPEVPDGS